MMDFLKPYLGLIQAASIIAVALGLFAGGVKVGAGHVQSKWDKERAANATAAIREVDQRIAENEIEREKNRETNRIIQRAHDAELERVRAVVGNAPRMRPGAGICGRSAGATEAGGAGGGNGANSGSRLVREDVGRDIDALKIRVEEVLAAGRACQKFVTENRIEP
jgi:hypothetical protein